ncbi:MAG: aminotransferase class I/II-fold pyridoxal phosphate-dependent enzyme [Planctomycetes bacterium]|nr:aminotransferase class I/II-fold pyridoxal phosphate-dependent enzyme [Planctomycetota bacterium]
MPVLPAHVDLRLDGNQGRAPGPDFFAALADAEAVRRYPLDRDLEQVLAAHHGVVPEQVFVGAGGDDVLDRLCRAVLEPGREAIVPVPTFEMLERHVASSGGTLLALPWQQGPWPRAEVLARVGPATALVALVSPNNPTGLVASAEDVRAVAAAAPHAVLLVDAAYAEFADQDLTQVALGLPNAVVLRTFSKAHGLAGLRVGYALAAPAVVGWLRAVGGAFPCGTWARRAAAHRLATGAAEVADYVAQVRHERQVLREQLLAAGLVVAPSSGNFVFAEGPGVAWLHEALLGLGIATRRLAGGLRITVPGQPEAFARLTAAVAAALAPNALLFDLDGVLVDLYARRALAAKDVLEVLGRQLPIGVVTSCPRRLAESVLERHGLAASVRALVTADDAPAKPDPAPVRLCLSRLQATSGWLLGDNPGDLLAARGAGVVPLAVTPVGVGAEAHAARLRAAGAARLVAGPAALLELLAALGR